MIPETTRTIGSMMSGTSTAGALPARPAAGPLAPDEKPGVFPVEEGFAGGFGRRAFQSDGAAAHRRGAPGTAPCRHDTAAGVRVGALQQAMTATGGLSPPRKAVACTDLRRPMRPQAPQAVEITGRSSSDDAATLPPVTRAFSGRCGRGGTSASCAEGGRP
jgi:hypothetical protein